MKSGSRWRSACIHRLAFAILFSGVYFTNSTSGHSAEARFCFNEWRPYAFVRDGRPVGISVEIMTAATRLAKMDAVFTELPWNRCLAMVRQGELDAVLDAAKRDEFLQGPTSYSVYSNTIWVRGDSPVKRLDFPALRNATIGLVDGYEYPPELLSKIAAHGIKIEMSVDDSTNLRKLAFDRVQAIVGDYVGTLFEARETGLDMRALEPDHSADRLYPSFFRGRAGLQRVIDGALAKLVSDGFVDSVYRKYVGQSPKSLVKPAARPAN